jgi:hypothetical protein
VSSVNATIKLLTSTCFCPNAFCNDDNENNIEDAMYVMMSLTVEIFVGLIQVFLFNWNWKASIMMIIGR